MGAIVTAASDKMYKKGMIQLRGVEQIQQRLHTSANMETLEGIQGQL